MMTGLMISHFWMTEICARLTRSCTAEEPVNLMKTDIQEMKDGYKMEVDLPGFKKDEITVELDDGYLTISAAKGLDQDEKEKESGR